MAYVESHAFKFADRLQINFLCEITLCIKAENQCNNITVCGISLLNIRNIRCSRLTVLVSTLTQLVCQCLAMDWATATLRRSTTMQPALTVCFFGLFVVLHLFFRFRLFCSTAVDDLHVRSHCLQSVEHARGTYIPAIEHSFPYNGVQRR